jgi:SAM-dependent methyltransferase
MNVFYSRAMDGMNPDNIITRDKIVQEALERLNMKVINPFNPNDRRRQCIAGITQIVEADLKCLQESEILVVDLSIQGRNYVGAVMEMLRAYDLGKETYVWVGESDNNKRIWLRHHATAICRTFEALLEVLEVTFTLEGQERSRRGTMAYYDSVAAGYDVDKRTGRFRNTPASDNTFERYQFEWQTFRTWTRSIETKGTVVDLGSGTGEWASTWARRASKIVCIDASIEMLQISQQKNHDALVEHVRGDILDREWLRAFLTNVPCEVVVLGFVIGSLTLRQEEELINVIRDVVSAGTLLVVLENQCSIFSNSDWFSRIEVQERPSLDGKQLFRVYKRNFLSNDLRRTLSQWGEPRTFFQTDNYFVGGTAVMA